MIRFRVALALGLLPLATGSCFEAVCKQSGVYGVRVVVRDQALNPQADSAVGILTDGSYRDSMRVLDLDPVTGAGLSLAGARDRAGIYDMCIRKAGFADYHQANVVVPTTACGIQGELFQITLVPPDSTSTVC